MKKFKTLLTTIGILALTLLPSVGIAQVAFAAVTAGDSKSNLCGGVELSAPGSTTDCTADTTSGTTVSNIVKTVINLLSWVVGVVAVIMIIIAGFKYVTSGGNDSSVASAKNTILYAIVGLVIVALAQVIVRFVLSNVTQ